MLKISELLITISLISLLDSRWRCPPNLESSRLYKTHFTFSRNNVDCLYCIQIFCNVPFNIDSILKGTLSYSTYGIVKFGISRVPIKAKTLLNTYISRPSNLILLDELINETRLKENRKSNFGYLLHKGCYVLINIKRY